MAKQSIAFLLKGAGPRWLACKPFRSHDFIAIEKMMKQSVIFGGRNHYDPAVVKTAVFEYRGIGCEG